ncbi:MAG TPA: hypothetical protein VGN72_23665 [Tepidisphaeraceae bacterium]|jgi:hypothetical protein|nr:hypothetical protein [Tepidisphaeraceae bacterium]
MSKQIEAGLSALENLSARAVYRKADRNEDTTRLHLVDALFFEVLGWDKAECVTEEAHGGEYADYVFSNPQPILIVEAKREGKYFEVTSGSNDPNQSLRPLIRGNAELKAALEQVCGYCQTRGVKYGVATNGHQIVAMVAVRDDGVPPLDGRALVFGSFEEIKSSFHVFWNGLSREGIADRNLTRMLLGKNRPHVPARLSASIFPYPGVKGRNRLQAQLQVLSELALEDLPKSKELKEEFLKRCYCQSGALSQHSATARNLLLARYAALFDSESPGPVHSPASTKSGITQELLAESISRRPILLIGDVGVGKTTFIDHLTYVEAKQILAKSVMLYVDLGSEATLTRDVQNHILEVIARQLHDNYDVNVDDDGFVREVYEKELTDFERGIFGRLKASAQSVYLEKEIAHLAGLIGRRDQHIRRALEHLSLKRNHQIVLFIDNADQRIERDYAVQQQSFLIAEEIAKNWPVMVFLTLRPETFHRSLKSGSLSGYHPKAFTIAPPRIDEVLQKRFTFSQRLLTQVNKLPANALKLAPDIQKINVLMDVFQRSLRVNPDLARFIDNIAAGNVRLALDMVRNFFGSGHVDTSYILEVESRKGERYVIPVHQFFRAIAFGDNEHYSPDATPIANLFDIVYPDPKEHFLRPLLLSILYENSRTGDGFVETGAVYSRLQSLGYLADQVDEAILQCLQKKLLETSGRRNPALSTNPSSVLRITQIGAYHISELCMSFQYIDTILVDVPVTDSAVRSSMDSKTYILDRLARCRMFCGYLDECWNNIKPSTIAWNWPQVRQRIVDSMARVEASAKKRERYDLVD